MIILNTRLRELRESKELSQKELAVFLNVKQATISTWELGTREPNLAMIENICKFFDCTADYLLGLTDY